MAQEGGVQGMSAKAGLKTPTKQMKNNKKISQAMIYAPICAPNYFFTPLHPSYLI